MNKQIKQLMEQTLDKHFSHTWTVMDYEDVNKFAEKFAELIVKESLEFIPQSSDWYERIAEHFGVLNET